MSERAPVSVHLPCVPEDEDRCVPADSAHYLRKARHCVRAAWTHEEPTERQRLLEQAARYEWHAAMLERQELHQERATPRALARE